MTSKPFSLVMIGIIAVASIALVALFSSQTATAQMMTTQNQMMQQSNNPQQQQSGMNHNMFSVMGMSMVPDVRVSGVSIAGDNTVSVNLTYMGNGTSPSVTVVAMTNHMAMMMNMMMGPGMMDGMPSNMMAMMSTADSHTGSAVVNSGWQSGSSISIRLEGDTSARDASDICVMVFPHLT